MKEIRQHYPVTRSGLFLNHAATAPVGSGVIKRMHSEVELMSEPLGKHFYQSLGVLEETRRLLAELIGAHPKEIALAPNTSTALSMISLAVPFRAGDRVLFPSDEFPSNRYVWQNLKSQGVECHAFDPEPGVPIVETLAKQDLKRVRLISISAVSYRTGRRYEIEEFATFCRKHEILSCIDAIQEIGAVSVDVKKTGVDFLACGSQKWLLGPIGAAFMYCRHELLEQLRVPFTGWTSVKYPENYGLPELDFASEMTRFEAGLPNLLPIIGLNESLKELQTYGWKNIFSELAQNRKYLAQGLEGLGLRLLTAPTDGVAGIASFEVPENLSARELGEKLHHADITITQRDQYVRVSPHFYTETSELDRFLEFIGKELKRTPQKVTVAPQPIKLTKGTSASAIVVGASGILGRQIAKEMYARGFDLVLLAREVDGLEAVARSLRTTRSDGKVEIRSVDLTKNEGIDSVVNALVRSGEKFSALVNCAGFVESDLFLHLTDTQFDEMTQTNLLGPVRLIRAFLTRLKSESALGVLNIVSSSGRCGYPLLSGYGSSSGALWTLSESLERELGKDGIAITTFVAPAMHSKMQKKMGRAALRYFKMSGTFDYEHADHVAKHAVESFLQRKGVVIHPANRFKLLINTLLPRLMSDRIAKVWKA